LVVEVLVALVVAADLMAATQTIWLVQAEAEEQEQLFLLVQFL
jgi:hypothetical protein